MKQATFINGETYWFFYCCEHELSAVLHGPFKDEEKCKREANSSTCTNAHFLTQFVPPHIRISYYNGDFDQATGLWIDRHNEEARLNPLYYDPYEDRDLNYEFIDGVTDYDAMIKEAFSHG